MRKIYLLLTLALLLSGCGAGAAGETDGLTLDLAEGIGVYAPLNETGQLRVSALYYEDTEWGGAAELTAAKAIFERDHPGWQVLIEPEGAINISVTDNGDGTSSAVSTSDTAAEERYFSELPDRLTESGPDIISLAGTDRRRLEREGRLEDLLPLIQGDDRFSLDQLLPGVLLSLSHEQALYSMPTSFSVDTLWYGYALGPDEMGSDSLPERPALWTWETMADYFKPEIERLGLKYLLPVPPRFLLTNIINNHYPAIYDAQAHRFHFETAFFKEVLTTVESLLDQGLLMDPAEDGDDFLYGQEGGLLLIIALGGDIEDFATLQSPGYFTYYPMPTLRSAEGMAIMPQEMFAVSAHAPEKAAAWEFMKIMLSDEVQNIATLRHHPVVSALSETAPASGETPAFMTAPGFDLAAYNRERFAFFEDIDRVYGANGAPNVTGIITEHADKFFKGEATLDETVMNIQAAADKMLLEWR